MPTDADFLAAVIADPDADGPRLIYADWLEENGDEARAEFIRLQCSTSGLPEHELEHSPPIWRCASLLSQNYDRWILPLQRTLYPGGEADWWQPIRSVLSRAAEVFQVGPSWWSDRSVNRLLGRNWFFRRGFAQKLHVRSAVLLPVAGAIVRQTPLQSLVVQLDDSHTLADVARLQHWQSLRSLALLGNGGPPENLSEALSSPSLSSIRRLGLQKFSFIQSDFESLAQCELMSRLERLTIAASLRGGVGRLEPMLGNLPGSNLRRLALNNLWLENQAQMVLDRLPAMPHLTHLDLANNPIGDADLESLLNRLPALTHLNLGNSGLTDIGLHSMLHSDRLRQLRVLNLSEAAITDPSALDLVDSPNLVDTTRINLRGVPLSEPVQRALRFRLRDRVLL